MQELLFECNLLELTAIREWNALWEYVPANWGLRPLPVSPFSPEGKACQWWRNLGRDGGGRFLVMFQKLGCFYCFRLCVFTTPKFYLCSLCKSERLSCIKKKSWWPKRYLLKMFVSYYLVSYYQWKQWKLHSSCLWRIMPLAKDINFPLGFLAWLR